MSGIRQYISQIAAFAVAGFLASSFASADYRQFPGAQTDNRTLRVQERVEEIYVSGDHDRALLIYERELAPIGDKYAQYMVGFMHLYGEGTEEDPVEALAWYSLAAERGEKPLVKARDELAGKLASDQRGAAYERFAQLWAHYGDGRLLLKLVREDIDELKRRRLPGGDGITDPRTRVTFAAGYAGSEGAADPRTRRYRERALERLEYIETYASAENAGIEPNDARARQLEEEAQQLRRELEVATIRQR